MPVSDRRRRRSAGWERDPGEPALRFAARFALYLAALAAAVFGGYVVLRQSQSRDIEVGELLAAAIASAVGAAVGGWIRRRRARRRHPDA